MSLGDVKGQIKSKKRVADHGEVLTPEREVNAMLDLVKHETERIESRFLEPACGDGNFLAEILRRKLDVVTIRYGDDFHEWEKYAVLAVTSIYGVDILEDNVKDCQMRLFDIFEANYLDICNEHTTDECRQAVRYILSRNIFCGDALTMKTKDDNPIVFSEWSIISGDLIKRRDFDLSQMLYGHEKNLFTRTWKYDDEVKAFIPPPVREFSPIHYFKVHTYG
ncbi:MAG: SAM-dependent DNA methyltransferase [Deltaproteobacteria bacterium]|jgi:hypothetical protein|nr:SAM-dependent DNA methyltransferase [Deltaproteobacteria bacterium]